MSLVIHRGCDCLWDFHIQSLPEFVCLFCQESSSSYSSKAGRPPAALCLNCLGRPQVTVRILDFGLGLSGPFSFFLMNKLNAQVTSGSPKAGASSRAFLRVRKASRCCCPHADGSFSPLCSFTEGPASEWLGIQMQQRLAAPRNSQTCRWVFGVGRASIASH